MFHWNCQYSRSYRKNEFFKKHKILNPDYRKYDYFMFSANRALNIPGMDKMSPVELRKNGCQEFSMTPYEQLFRRIQVQRAQHFIDRLEKKSNVISEMYGGTTPSKERTDKIYTYQSTFDNQIKREKQIIHLVAHSSIDYTGEKTIADPMGDLHHSQYLELGLRILRFL